MPRQCKPPTLPTLPERFALAAAVAVGGPALEPRVLLGHQQHQTKSIGVESQESGGSGRSRRLRRVLSASIFPNVPLIAGMLSQPKDQDKDGNFVNCKSFLGIIPCRFVPWGWAT